MNMRSYEKKVASENNAPLAGAEVPSYRTEFNLCVLLCSFVLSVCQIALSHRMCSPQGVTYMSSMLYGLQFNQAGLCDGLPDCGCSYRYVFWLCVVSKELIYNTEILFVTSNTNI